MFYRVLFLSKLCFWAEKGDCVCRWGMDLQSASHRCVVNITTDNFKGGFKFYIDGSIEYGAALSSSQPVLSEGRKSVFSKVLPVIYGTRD